MKILRILLTITLLNSTMHAMGQTTDHVIGKILDEDNKTIQGATITAEKITDTTKRVNSVSDSTGRFSLKVMGSGYWRLTIAFVSYQTVKKSFIIANDTAAINIGTIIMYPAKQMLNEVRIVAERPFMTQEPDKTVFDAAKIGAVSSGTASDLLTQIPLVNVGPSGDITVRGKAAGVLIDGKPSPYTDVSTALQMIPSTSVERVEVMPTPSAKYDAAGQGGLINIILKKNIKAGFNGVVNLDAATQFDDHAGTDLNYRNKHIRVFANLNYHANRIFGNRTSQQFFPLDNTTLIQKASNTDKHQDLDSRLGFDYLFNDKTDLSITQNIGSHTINSSSLLTIDSAQNNNRVAATGSNDIITRNNMYSTTLDFTKRFAKDGEELTATARYVNEQSHTSGELDNINGSFYNSQVNKGNGKNKMYLLQTDFADPIGSNGKIELGYKSTWFIDNNILNATTLNDTTGNYFYNNALSNNFTYNQQVHALYALYSGKLGSFKYKAGLRSELDILSGESRLTNTSTSSRHLNFFPSLYFSKSLTDNQSLSIAYDTRIARPSFLQILPYTDISNPINHQSGNPGLSDAYTHHAELTYVLLMPKSNSMFSASVYYSNTVNSIQLVTLPQHGYLLTTPENIGREATEGADIIYRLNIKKLFSVTGTYDLNYNTFNGSSNTTSNVSGFWNSRLHLDGNIFLPAKFILAAHGEISGPQHIPQGYNISNRGIDVEVKHNFLNNKVTVAVMVSDIFHQRRQSTHLVASQFIEDDILRENSRIVHFHLSYIF